MDVSRSSRPCMRVGWSFEVRRKDLRPMASSPLSRADMVNSSRGLTGSGTFGMRKEPGRPVFAGPRTTGRKAAARPSAPA